MGTTSDAVGHQDRPAAGEPSWRDDPFVLDLMQVDMAQGTDRDANPSTLVLVDGVSTTVTLDRWDAIDAGYVVLDGEPEPLVRPQPDDEAVVVEAPEPAVAAAFVEAPTVAVSPALPGAPASRARADVNDWLRAISQAAHGAPRPVFEQFPVVDAPRVDVPSPVLVEARGLSKRYGRPNGAVDALSEVDVEIRQGELVAVSGPSGSGKSSLLYCLSGLEDIDAGEVIVAGEAMHLLSDAEKTALRARTMGFVFQTYHLIEHMTAIENVEMPLLLNGWGASEARAEAIAGLESVGLGARADHRPGELSGGEQQRVAVARALVGDPQIVWADEPTGNLDDATAGLVMDLLRARNADGLTVVLVTHDAALVASATRRITLAAGRIVPEPSSAA